jgi:subtilisin family serine protease
VSRLEEQMSRPSTVFRSVTAAVGLAVAAALAAVPQASAQPQAPAETSAVSVVARHTVTLITSDVVEVQTMSDGNVNATIKPTADRTNPSFASRRLKDQLYIIPADAMAMLAAGKLDQELFNVSALIANGYDDSHSAAIPLIVQYEPGLRAQAAPPGTTGRFSLESINAKSMQEAKTEASAFWKSLSDEGRLTANAASVRKIWLNGRARATLSESVPQVGAPQAWAAGYDGTGVKVAVLDTGIDTTHPDLDAGKVVAAQNFSDDTDTLDHFGHGTHVASIVAGTGEASTTVRKGVAPGASLINAKVLNSGGSGSFDQIIEGLEWAAAQGADIASMSLGTNAPAEGTDPLIEAVDSLSRSSGMLIVIAAGNLGSGESTIASPGWADEALTVGAVDKKDKLAGFSSRGPRLGDFAIKPDISAPGVDIVAARAAGTEIGPIVDEKYQQLSGTSMATPHVSGAAAILAQRFPNYTNDQLKNTLISTAKTQPDQTAYQQGGGRLDVARGYSQQVYASPATLNLGFFPFPHTAQEPVSKAVTYTNDTAADVTLNLALQVSGKDSGPAPAGMFTVSRPTVTVPAGGSASVTVTVDPHAGTLDRFGGYLVATSGDTVVHTTVGAYVEPEMYNLTVTGIAHDGRPAAVISWAELWSLQTGQFTQKFYSADSNTVTFRVAPGTYNLVGYLATADAANTFATEVATVAEPQLEMTGDRTVTLDARTANQLVLDTPKPSSPVTFTMSYHRDLGELNFHSSFTLSPPIGRAYASPTATVTKGGFEFYSKWDLIAPPLLAKVTAPQDIPLDAQPMTNAAPVDGKHNLPIVYVGLGKPEDYVGKDMHGKIALIMRGELTFADKVINATKAGASAAMIFNNRPGLLLAGAGNPGEVTIHGLTVDQATGQMLLSMLQQGQVKVQLSGTAISPYLYDLLLPEKQRIPASLNYTINKSNTAEVDTSYTADVPVLGTDVRHIARPWPTFSVGFVRDVPRPLHRTYLVSANDTRWWHIAWSNSPFDGEFDHAYTRYAPRALVAETWFGRVARPGASALFDTQVSRTGDEFDMAVFPFSDSGGHFGWGGAGDVFSTKLFMGSQLLKETAAFPFDTFPAKAQAARYRLVLNGKRVAPWSKYSTETNTTWTFDSSRPAAGATEHPALVQVDYGLALDELNRAADRGAYTFTLTVGHIPGATGPAIADTQAWVSFNDGGTWRRVDTVDLGGGVLQATVQHPALANTSGAVSLRVKATDTAGNSVDQYLYRAYGLKASA